MVANPGVMMVVRNGKKGHQKRGSGGRQFSAPSYTDSAFDLVMNFVAKFSDSQRGQYGSQSGSMLVVRSGKTRKKVGLEVVEFRPHVARIQLLTS